MHMHVEGPESPTRARRAQQPSAATSSVQMIKALLVTLDTYDALIIYIFDLQLGY